MQGQQYIKTYQVVMQTICGLFLGVGGGQHQWPKHVVVPNVINT